jgi:hypothetical protein
MPVRMKRSDIVSLHARLCRCNVTQDGPHTRAGAVCTSRSLDGPVGYLAGGSPVACGLSDDVLPALHAWPARDGARPKRCPGPATVDWRCKSGVKTYTYVQHQPTDRVIARYKFRSSIYASFSQQLQGRDISSNLLEHTWNWAWLRVAFCRLCVCSRAVCSTVGRGRVGAGTGLGQLPAAA